MIQIKEYTEEPDIIDYYLKHFDGRFITHALVAEMSYINSIFKNKSIANRENEYYNLYVDENMIIHKVLVKDYTI